MTFSNQKTAYIATSYVLKHNGISLYLENIFVINNNLVENRYNNTLLKMLQRYSKMYSLSAKEICQLINKFEK